MAFLPFSLQGFSVLLGLSIPLWLNGPPLLFFAITRRLCHSAQHNIHFSSLGAPKQLGRHLAFVSSFLETCQVELSCLLEQWWRHSVLLQGPELGFERCETAEHYLNALPKEYKIRQNSPSVDARSKTSIPVTTVAWKFLSCSQTFPPLFTVLSWRIFVSPWCQVVWGFSNSFFFFKSVVW